MKQNKNLIKEINTIKKLMGISVITEQSSNDQDCINQLTDNNGDQYIVVPKDECLSKMGCVVNSIKSYGFDNISQVAKWGDGRCYVKLNFSNKRYLIIWETGELSFIYVFKDIETLPNKKEIKKFIYEGNWKCDNNDTTYSDITFKSLVTDDGQTLKPENFETSGNWKVENYFDGQVGMSGNLKDFLIKIFK